MPFQSLKKYKKVMETQDVRLFAE